MAKTFIGPRLRRLRQERGETQALMAKGLGISTSYVNLLEKNERPVSVPVLLKLFETYGVDWRDIAEDEDTAAFADLRGALADPLFEGARPDLTQLRAAMAHCPDLAAAFLRVHRAYQAATEQIMSISGAQDGDSVHLKASPETVVHNFFRDHRNHFPALEKAADRFWGDRDVPPDEVYTALKERLRARLGLRVRLVPVAEMPEALREYDEDRKEVRLSEALDHPNRVFQLIHVSALIEQREALDAILAASDLDDPARLARCRVELANYFAAAVLMPYRRFLTEARASKYDFDHLATRFGVSFEQACHRATTLQRSSARGVPFFFMRVDKAGNVTKRFNSTDFQLAQYGGACPRLDVHVSFRTPGRVVPQVVEMPDGSQFFVFARSVDRPSFSRHTADTRLAVAMGCAIEHAAEIGYAEEVSFTGTRATPIGINCRVCPRANCDQRAHHAILLATAVNENRRGATRYGV